MARHEKGLYTCFHVYTLHHVRFLDFPEFPPYFPLTPFERIPLKRSSVLTLVRSDNDRPLLPLADSPSFMFISIKRSTYHAH